MNQARVAREDRADWQTARIVAMLANIHGKKHNQQPVDFMWRRDELKVRDREAQAARASRGEGMSGDEILARLRAFGVPIIDTRAEVTNGID